MYPTLGVGREGKLPDFDLRYVEVVEDSASEGYGGGGDLDE